MSIVKGRGKDIEASFGLKTLKKPGKRLSGFFG